MGQGKSLEYQTFVQWLPSSHVIIDKGHAQLTKAHANRQTKEKQSRKKITKHFYDYSILS